MTLRPMTLKPSETPALTWVRASKPGLVFALQSAAGTHAEVDIVGPEIAKASFLGSDGRVKKLWRFTKDVGFFGGTVKVEADPRDGNAIEAKVGTFGGAEAKLPNGETIAWENAAGARGRHWIAPGAKKPVLTLDTATMKTGPVAMRILDPKHPQLGVLIVTGFYLAYIDLAAKNPETIAGAPAGAFTAAGIAALAAGAAMAAAPAAAQAKEEAKKQSASDSVGEALGTAADAVDVAGTVGDIIGGLFSLFD